LIHAAVTHTFQNYAYVSGSIIITNVSRYEPLLIKKFKSRAFFAANTGSRDNGIEELGLHGGKLLYCT
jgi:hypothetical protein